MPKCDNCDGEFSKADLIHVPDEDKLLCTNCIDAGYEQCDDCNEYVTKDNIIEVHKGRKEAYVCNGCVEENYARCVGCKEFHKKEYMQETAGGDLVCQVCINNADYRKCDICKELFDSDEITYIESVGQDVCDNCFSEKFGQCEECEQDVLNDELIDGRCESCRNALYHTDTGPNKCLVCGIEMDEDREKKGYCEKCHEVLSPAFKYITKEEAEWYVPNLEKRVAEVFLQSIKNSEEKHGLSDAERNLAYYFPTVKFDFDNLTYKAPPKMKEKPINELVQAGSSLFKALSCGVKYIIQESVSLLINKRRDRIERATKFTEGASPKIINAIRYRIWNERHEAKKTRAAIEKVRGIYKMNAVYYLEITDDPIALLAKSTSHDWEERSCEKYGGQYSQGIFNDIMFSNLIAFVRDKKGKEYARIMLRWCFHDEKKVGYGIETVWYCEEKEGICYDHKAKYNSEVFIAPALTAKSATSFIADILYQNGLYDYDVCMAPYVYRGYSDREQSGGRSPTYRKFKK